MKCFTDHCAWCAMHEEEPVFFYCCTPDFFDGLTQSCKSVFFFFCTVCHFSLHVGFFSLRVPQGFLYSMSRW